MISLDIIQYFFYSYLNLLTNKNEIIRYTNHFNFLKNYIFVKNIIKI